MKSDPDKVLPAKFTRVRRVRVGQSEPFLVAEVERPHLTSEEGAESKAPKAPTKFTGERDLQTTRNGRNGPNGRGTDSAYRIPITT